MRRAPRLRYPGAALLCGLLGFCIAPACSRTGLPVPIGSNGGGGTTSASTSTGLCAAATTIKAQESPLDLYVMLDQSGSMSDIVAGGLTKWVAVTNAIQAFVDSPDAAGVGIGIQYFAVAPGGGSCPLTCKTNIDCGDACGECSHPFGGETGTCWDSVNGGGGESCNAADYANPEVEIANLPGNAPSIVTSMNNHTPTTGTPTSAALQGAVDHAKEWAKANPGHAVVDVLATDGDPTECDTDLQHIDGIAAGGASGTPKIRTFVIGVGSSTSNLNGIAAAGGTDHAYIVDTNGDTNAQFLKALQTIRHVVLACSYQVPTTAMGKVDPKKVNVQYSAGGGVAPVTLSQVLDAAACPANGYAWYYDNAAKPTNIILCSSTCNIVSANAQAQVDIVLGCMTES